MLGLKLNHFDKRDHGKQSLHIIDLLTNVVLGFIWLLYLNCANLKANVYEYVPKLVQVN